MKESFIQSKIIKDLEAAGWMVVKLIQTNKNGIPDLLCLKNKETVFIEVKSEKGIVSELQKYRHRQLAQQNFLTIIAYSTKDILKLCN